VNDKTWRNVSIALGLMCVVLIAVAGVLLASGGNSPSPTATGTLIASLATQTPGGSTAGTPTTGTQTSGASNTATHSLAPSPKPTASPNPTQAQPTASITFNDMMLDAQGDPHATARTFTFVSDGPGPVSAMVTRSSSSSASVKMCIKIDAGAQTCTAAGVKPGFGFAYADRPHDLWVVTLMGVGAATPTVDVTFSWPTGGPSITLAHGRLQGSSSPGIPESLNGFNATFKPRGGGAISVGAAWTVIVTDVDLGLADVTGTPASNVDEVQFHGVQAIDPPYTHSVDAGRKYKVMFRDLDADSRRPDLSATISFP